MAISSLVSILTWQMEFFINKAVFWIAHLLTKFANSVVIFYVSIDFNMISSKFSFKCGITFIYIIFWYDSSVTIIQFSDDFLQLLDFIKIFLIDIHILLNFSLLCLITMLKIHDLLIEL